MSRKVLQNMQNRFYNVKLENDRAVEIMMYYAWFFVLYRILQIQICSNCKLDYKSFCVRHLLCNIKPLCRFYIKKRVLRFSRFCFLCSFSVVCV